MSYDNESPQPDDDLCDTESLQPYISICNPIIVYIILVELIIPGVLKNFQSTTYGYVQVFHSLQVHNRSWKCRCIEQASTFRITAGNTYSPRTDFIDGGIEHHSNHCKKNQSVDQFRLLCSQVRQFVQSSWPDSVQDVQLKPFATSKDQLSVQDGCILWGNWLIIPKAGRGDMLRELHEAHPEETRMKRLARMFVWWPGLDHDIEQKVKGCHECLNCRPNPPLASLIPWKWPSQPWSHLRTDFVETFKGQMFLVVTTQTTMRHLRAILPSFVYQKELCWTMDQPFPAGNLRISCIRMGLSM